MAKIAIIGAGSIVFCKTLLNDMFATKALEGSTYALMDLQMDKLVRMENYAKKIIEKNNLSARVYSTTDRREALKDADYVIAMFQVGGVDAFRVDYEIPMKYGVDQCIGDSLGPGGVFRGLRTIPVFMDMVREMEELCPKAILLNYVNPMATVCLAIGRISNISFVGLCHGVQTTMDLIAGYVGVKKEEIDYVCAGINHMAWFLKLEKDGKDLYPILKEKIEKPEYYINEKVRCEVMRHFGYFMTESTGHLSEYLPWFRKNKKALDLYCDQPDFGGASGAYYKWCDAIAKKYKEVDFLSFESGDLEPRSKEYCSYLIEAVETGNVFKLNGNVMNKGYITNLPYDSCVEVPIYVDKNGLNPVVIGDLPSQLAALNQSNVTVQSLAAEAALKGDPELAFSAIAMDPLTSSVLTLKEIRDMTIEMFEAHRCYLPQFEGKALRKVDVIDIPEGTIGVDTPLDPALAIVHRFSKLAENK
ncbi:MAG: alpha-galactosidase [Mahellales bacterium]